MKFRSLGRHAGNYPVQKLLECEGRPRCGGIEGSLSILPNSGNHKRGKISGIDVLESLTRAGKALFKTVFPKAIAQDEQMRSVLTDEEQHSFLCMTNKLITSILAADK